MTVVSLDSRRSRSALVPFVLLGPAVAWLLSLAVSYVVHDFICAAAETAGTTAPLTGLRVGIVAFNVVLLAVAVVAGVLAVAVYRSARPSADETPKPLTGPARFVGLAGIGMAVLFGLGIVLIATTPVVVGAC